MPKSVENGPKDGYLRRIKSESGKDSKYSWFICITWFLCRFMTTGFTYTLGSYYVEFLDVFEENSATTSWVSSLNYGTLSLTGNSIGILSKSCPPHTSPPHI